MERRLLPYFGSKGRQSQKDEKPTEKAKQPPAPLAQGLDPPPMIVNNGPF